MPLISFQELLLVLTGVYLIIACHICFYRRVHLYPLTTASGITNHARQMWVEEDMKNKRDILAVQTLRNQVYGCHLSGFNSYLQKSWIDQWSVPSGYVFRDFA